MSGANSSTNPNVQESNSQILNDIQSLQALEQEMFNNLEENNTLTQEQQQSIIQNINQISTMRINLYETLSGVNSFYQTALTNSQGTLTEQEAAIDIVEQELNRAKENLRILEEEKNNKIRLVEINTYYGEKYQEHAELMKIIIYTLIPVIILTILYSNNILPSFVYYILLFIVAIVGSYFLWFRLMSIWSRDNMNYQEYEWPFYPGDLNKSSTISGDPWAGENIGGCLDQECCAPGTIFDSSINQCVIPTTSSTTTTSPYGQITPSLTSSSSNFVTNTATSIYNDSANAINTGVSDVTSGASSLYNDASSALSGIETFVSNSNINEIFTKHSRKYTKPVATLGSYVPTAKFSDSFINY
jgi:hypothetical protein